MSDLISRQAAIDESFEIYVDGQKFEVVQVETLMGLPSADRPQGEWIYGEHDVAMCDGYRCDRCGFFVPWDYEHKFIDFINDYNFCPSCGSKMRGEHDD